MGSSAPAARAFSVSCSSRYAARSGPSSSKTCANASVHSAVSCGLRSTNRSLNFWCMDTTSVPWRTARRRIRVGFARGGRDPDSYNVDKGFQMRKRGARCAASPCIQWGHMVRLEHVLDTWKTIRQDTIAAVEEFPADQYSFRPSDDVMTFGEIAHHILNAGHALTGLLLAGEEKF